MTKKNEQIYLQQENMPCYFEIDLNKVDFQINKEAKNESGSAISALIMTVACFFLYLKFIHNYLEVNIHTLFASLVMIILAVACMFAFINFVTSLIRGDSSSSSIKKEILSELDVYDEIVLDSKEELRKYEDKFSDNKISITAEGLESISLIRKIIAALRDRSDNVRSLLSTKSELAFVQAVETMNSNLLVKEDGFLTAVTRANSEEAPELKPDNALPLIKNLFEEVSKEVEVATPKVAERI